MENEPKFALLKIIKLGIGVRLRLGIKNLHMLLSYRYEMRFNEFRVRGTGFYVITESTLDDGETV